MPTDPQGRRCASHPGRPAVDCCPVCERPRCGADVLPTGCRLCVAPGDQGPVRREAGHLERLVRAALAAFGAAMAGSYVTQQYVEATWLQYFAPAVLGVVCASAAVAASGHPRPGRLAQQVRAAAALYALAGVANGFVLEASHAPTSADPVVLVPYALAAGAAWLWAAPPRSARAPR